MQWLPSVFMEPRKNPVGDADHYNNPRKEHADWVKNVDAVAVIGNHTFYKSR